MSPRPDVTEERTQQILDAAMVVFAESGFHDARMDDVADEAGLSKGTLYWYFDSKDDIILTIMERLFDVELEDLKALLNGEGPVRKRLSTYFCSFAQEMQQMADFMPIAYEFYAAASRRERVRTFLSGYFEAYRDVLADFVRQGIERDEFRCVDPDAVAITIIALYEGLNLLWVTDPAAFPLEKQIEASAELVLDSIRVE